MGHPVSTRIIRLVFPWLLNLKGKVLGSLLAIALFEWKSRWQQKKMKQRGREAEGGRRWEREREREGEERWRRREIKRGRGKGWWGWGREKEQYYSRSGLAIFSLFFHSPCRNPCYNSDELLVNSEWATDSNPVLPVVVCHHSWGHSSPTVSLACPFGLTLDITYNLKLFTLLDKLCLLLLCIEILKEFGIE